MSASLIKNEELDALVAQHVMGWPPAAMGCTQIPIPEYSNSWQHVGAVLNQLRHDKDFERLLKTRLNQDSQRLYADTGDEDWCWEDNPSLVFFYLDPEIICRAALQAIDLRDRSEETV